MHRVCCLALLLLIVPFAAATRCDTILAAAPQPSKIGGCYDFDDATNTNTFLVDRSSFANHAVLSDTNLPRAVVTNRTPGNALYCHPTAAPCNVWIPSSVFTSGTSSPLDGFSLSFRYRTPGTIDGRSLTIQGQTSNYGGAIGGFQFYTMSGEGLASRYGTYFADIIGNSYGFTPLPTDKTGDGRFFMFSTSFYHNSTSNRTCARTYIDNARLYDGCTTSNSAPPHTAMPGVNSRGIAVGYSNNNAVDPNPFFIDEIVVWSVPLSDAEMSLLHSSFAPISFDPSTTGNSTTPAHHWKLDGSLSNSIPTSYAGAMELVTRQVRGKYFNYTPGYTFVNQGTPDSSLVGDMRSLMCSQRPVALSGSFTSCSTMRTVASGPINMPSLMYYMVSINLQASDAGSPSMQQSDDWVSTGQHTDASGTVTFYQENAAFRVTPNVLSANWKRVCLTVTPITPRTQYTFTWRSNGTIVYNWSYGGSPVPSFRDVYACLPSCQNVAIKDLTIYPVALSGSEYETDIATYLSTPPTPSPTSPGDTNVPTVGPTQQPTLSVTSAAPTVIVNTPAPTTLSPTATPSTATPTATPSTATPTATPSTAAPTATPSTATPTSTPTAVPSTATPSAQPSTATPTATPSTATPTATPSTATPTATPSTAVPTATPSTATPTTATPTTISPTATPSTATPTAMPTTAAPTTLSPTATPSTATPTALPTTAALTTLSPTGLPTTANPTAVPSTRPPTAKPTTVPPTISPTSGTTATPTSAVVGSAQITIGAAIPIGNGIGGGANGTSGTGANPEIGPSDGLGVDNTTARINLRSTTTSDPPFILTVNAAPDNFTTGTAIAVRALSSAEYAALKATACGAPPSGLVPLAAVEIEGPSSEDPESGFRVHLEIPSLPWSAEDRDGWVCDTSAGRWKTAAEVCTGRQLASNRTVYPRSVAVTSCKFQTIVFFEDASKDRYCISGHDCECSSRPDRTRSIVLPSIAAGIALVSGIVEGVVQFYAWKKSDGPPYDPLGETNRRTSPYLIAETLSHLAFAVAMILYPKADIGPSGLGWEPPASDIAVGLVSIGSVLAFFGMASVPPQTREGQKWTFASKAPLLVSAVSATAGIVIIAMTTTDYYQTRWVAVASGALYLLVPLVVFMAKKDGKFIERPPSFRSMRNILYGVALGSITMLVSQDPCADGLPSDKLTSFGS